MPTVCLMLVKTEFRLDKLLPELHSVANHHGPYGWQYPFFLKSYQQWLYSYSSVV